MSRPAGADRKARAEAEKAYQPYVHDVGKIGAKTGRPMPTNVPRVGPDAMESIDDFFRSPLASGSRAGPPIGGLSFASLADSPLGGMGEAGRSEGDLAVEEALARDETMGEIGSDSVEGTPSRYFRSKGLGTAPFPASSGRARAVTPPPAGDSYAALPSPSPTRTGRASHAAPTSGATASARHSLGSSRRGAGARRVSTLPRSDDDDDDDDVEQARLQGSPLSRGRPSIAASRAATSPGDGMTDYSPVARSRGRPSIAPSRAPTSPGDIGANETVEFDQSRDDSGGAGEDMDVHFDGGAGDEDQPGMDWGGGQPSSEGNERFDDNYDQPNEEDEQPPLEEVVDEEEEEEEIVVPSRAKGKGKRPRVVDPDDDDEERHEEPISAAEDEQIADDMLPAEEDDEEEEIRPAKGKGRKGKPAPTREKLPTAAEKGKSRAFTSRTAVQPRIVPLHDSDRTSEDEDDGSRRSKRQRFRPLEYWRGEKLIFGRRESGKSAVPIVKAVQELPPQDIVPYGQRKKARKGPAPSATKREGGGQRSKGRSASTEEPAEPEEAGWDRDTLEHGVVFDYTTKQEIERRIAFPAHLLEYRTMSSDPNGFKFQKVFGDASFVAAGMLEIPVDGEKPSKPTKDNTYLFYVIEGAVNVKIHRTSFTMAVGGQFMVPRGNQYSIHTISRRPAKLFFAQARRMASDEEDVPSVLTASQAPPAGAQVAGRAGGSSKRK